jgi:hypothetical protein
MTQRFIPGAGKSGATAPSSEAKAAQIVVSVVRRVRASTLTRIQLPFEQAGIVFLDSDASGGIGARLEKELQRGFYEAKPKTPTRHSKIVPFASTSILTFVPLLGTLHCRDQELRRQTYGCTIWRLRRSEHS